MSLNDETTQALALLRNRIQEVNDSIAAIRDGLTAKLAAALNNNDDLAAAVVRHSKENAALRAANRVQRATIEQSEMNNIHAMTAAVVVWSSRRKWGDTVPVDDVMELLDLIVHTLGFDKTKYKAAMDDKTDAIARQFRETEERVSLDNAFVQLMAKLAIKQ